MLTPADAIARYYDECWVDRLRAGHNPKSRAIHYGLYDGAPSHDDAKNAMAEFVGRRFPFGPTETRELLDAGCGVGGTSIRLATRNPGWSFTGLNLSPRQVALGTELVAQHQVADRVRFQVGDMETCRFEAARFDGVFAVESLCHVRRRRQFLRTVLQALRPGGVLVVADFARTDVPLRPHDADWYAQVKAGFAIHDYYDEPLGPLLCTAGFEVLEEHDITTRVAPGVHASAERATRALEEAPIGARWHAHHRTCIGLDVLTTRGQLRYAVTVAHRVGPAVSCVDPAAARVPAD